MANLNWVYRNCDDLAADWQTESCSLNLDNMYFKEAYNKLIAFLYGWSFFFFFQTGTIAAVGVAFSKFTAYLYPPVSDQNILYEMGSFKLNAAQLVSIATIILLTYINSKGVKNGKYIQTVFTITKIASLFGLIIFGFILAAKADIWNANWTDAWVQILRQRHHQDFIGVRTASQLQHPW